jgi:hypothetical protein
MPSKVALVAISVQFAYSADSAKGIRPREAR